MTKKLLGIASRSLRLPEINLIQTILRTSSALKEEWQLVDRGSVDALLVDDPGALPAAYQASQSTEKITVKRRGESGDGYLFLTPIRADELIDTLLSIGGVKQRSSARQAGQPLVDQPSLADTTAEINAISRYKLKRWPSNDLLAREKIYRRLAATISRSCKSPDELVQLTGLELEVCRDFLKLLQAEGILSNCEGQRVAPLESVPANDNRASFVKYIRNRFKLSAWR
ncbi:hypothetical protein [Halioxenophilus sp. WMMB6]|uniref:hypothetical protein n=1 Tax=Halioxenophilus sp. WMMB6 TaxID=3073815 RepID=UPI00295EACA2|nr:hypothetical protein [Halioxenophilus sp. WMMB6]